MAQFQKRNGSPARPAGRQKTHAAARCAKSSTSATGCCSSPATASRRSTSSCPTAFRARARCSRRFRISGSRNSRRLVPNHLLAGANDPLPENLQPFSGQAGAPLDDCEEGEATRHRVHRARLSFRQRLEGIQKVADRLRHQTARRPDGIRRTAGADFHAVHQGRGRP